MPAVISLMPGYSSRPLLRRQATSSVPPLSGLNVCLGYSRKLLYRPSVAAELSKSILSASLVWQALLLSYPILLAIQAFRRFRHVCPVFRRGWRLPPVCAACWSARHFYSFRFEHDALPCAGRPRTAVSRSLRSPSSSNSYSHLTCTNAHAHARSMTIGSPSRQSIPA